MKLLVLFFTVFALFGCDFSWFTKDPVVVTVGDVKLKESDLRGKVDGWDTLSNREKIAWVEAWINEEVLYQEALNQGIHKEKDIKERLYLIERKIVVEALISKLRDSSTMDVNEAKRYYEAHQESFVYDKWLWSGFILSYTDWKLASNYFKGKKETVFDKIPNEDYRLKKRIAFDSVPETPDSCLAADLRELPLRVLSSPILCDGALKSIVITSRQDSGAVIPFEQIKDQALILAQLKKQRDALDSIIIELKKKRPIFSNPQLFSDSLDQKRNK